VSFFHSADVNCLYYQPEWEAVVGQIKDWPSDFGYRDCQRRDYQWPLPRQISHHLEAKALGILTMARRLVRAAYGLAHCAEDWHLIFVEATILLFPMIELVGHARLEAGQVKEAYGKDEVNVANLWAGARWLLDPEELPQVKDNCLKHDSDRLDVLLAHMQPERTRGPEIRELIFTRNYFLHGSKAWDGLKVHMPDVLNYELPKAIADRAQEVMPIYWRQLRRDDGSEGWLRRLANADIRPFVIQGSGVFEEGLVDPDIVDYLEGRRDIWGNVTS
jgi:hypothetical protein